MRYRSFAQWPEGHVYTVPPLAPNTTDDSHDSKEMAEGVCRLLEKDGLGGEKIHFPVMTWIEPEDHRVEVPVIRVGHGYVFPEEHCKAVSAILGLCNAEGVVRFPEYHLRLMRDGLKGHGYDLVVEEVPNAKCCVRASEFVKDFTGSGQDRVSCTCGSAVVKQPYMDWTDWSVAKLQFKNKHLKGK